MIKFADDTNLGWMKQKRKEDQSSTWMDMDNLGIWKERSKMRFNVKKYNTIHLGKNNTQYRYKLGNYYLENKFEESDWGVITSNKLNRNSLNRHKIKSILAYEVQKKLLQRHDFIINTLVFPNLGNLQRKIIVFHIKTNVVFQDILKQPSVSKRVL